jgi:hypothetical protein
VTISFTDSSGDTGNTATQSVHFSNVAPTVAFTSAPASANEGDTKHYTYSISDPGVDTVQSVATSCGANGTKSNASNTDTSGSFDCTFPDGPADSTVSAQATDFDNDAGNTATQSVHVNNVAPSTPALVSPADGAVTNDNTPTFDWNDSTDPGVDSVSYTIQVDDNCDFSSPEIDQAGVAASQFTPATGLPDGTYCWRVKATDSDADSSAYSAARTVTIDTGVPTVLSINRADANPTNASVVHWTVMFSENVTGVDATDFVLANTGLGGSPAVTGVSGGGDTYTVTASTGAGSGTLGLNLVDDDSIADPADNKLGGTGAGNGSFTGEVYTIDRNAPSVTINQAATQLDPTSTAPIKFTVVFSEAVSDFTNADVDLSDSTAGGTLVANVYNSGDNQTFEVRVNGMTTAGDVIAKIGANKATDAAGNGNSASTSTDNKVTWQPALGNNTPTVYIDAPPFGSVYAKGSASITLKAHFTDPDNGPWTT